MTLPEYGRNIQNMVDYCVTIQDREERKRCANTIINIMGNMFPHLRDVNDFKHILWDHLAIMADFKLDIDYPYEIIKKENLYSRPPRIPYNNNRIRYRHYGKTLELMIRKATELQPGMEKDQLVRLLANQMKKFNDLSQTPIILVSQVIRGYFSKMITQFYPNVYVLSFNEITNSVQIQALGNITAEAPMAAQRRAVGT